MLGLFLISSLLSAVTAEGILFPRESESREVKSLDGIWKFSLSSANETGFEEEWFSTYHKKWMSMPVPSSYNDVTVNATIRDFVGWAWYQTTFYTPQNWKESSQRVFLRFGSVHYYTNVWVNGEAVGEHTGGHLPFIFDVTDLLLYNQSNVVTVALNNTLTHTTIPQGSVTHPNDTMLYPEGYVIYDYNFDFFNYAGIHRPVYLYTTPPNYIDDITVNTNIDGSTGIVEYEVDYVLGSNKVDGDVQCEVTLLDDTGSIVATGSSCQDELKVENANLWWPVYMNETAGYLYTLQVRLTGDDSEDIYRLPVGIRTISWEKGLQINGLPVYLVGFGKHEDSYIRGKGLDFPTLLRDYNLIEWVGANSYRTSHYPYAEEAMDLADSLGIMIIDESPAVDLSLYDEVMLLQHQYVMSELIRRDKNRPSVIMWSLTNEALNYEETAGPYYKELVSFVKNLDATRPVSYVANMVAGRDQAAQYLDIVGVNKYSSWYSDPGVISLIPLQVENYVRDWYETFGKPIYMSEYGADSVIGMHTLPASLWTEDYQCEVLQQHFVAFDNLRKEDFFIGEMVWNFADFATKQGNTRVVGNRKGMFTRERQPKEAAFVLRNRYRKLNAAGDSS